MLFNQRLKILYILLFGSAFLNSCSSSPAEEKFQEVLDVIGNDFSGGNFKLDHDPYFLAHPDWNIHKNLIIWDINVDPFTNMASDLEDFTIRQDTSLSPYPYIDATAVLKNGDEASFSLWVDESNILVMRVVLWGKFNHYIYLDLDERDETDEIKNILSIEVNN